MARDGESQNDSKLVHLVRKFLSFSVDENPNADHIVHCLRTQHREYQRKDLAKLKKQVQKVLKRLNKGDDPEGEEGGGGKPSSKRALEDAAEEAYEKKARKHDLERSLQLKDSSGLNSNLQARYQRLQQDRDDQAAATAAKLLEETIINAASEGGKKSRSSRDLASSKHDKSLKRKKSASSSKRGSSEGGFLAGLGENGGTDFVTQAVNRPTERYSDLGGMKDVLQQIRQLVEYPLVRPEVYRHLGVDPPRGVLLRGPPGCGKTHLANAIAGQLGVPYFRVSAPELVSGMSGESEGRIRDLFKAASDMAPAIVFLDELDAIAPKRSDAGSSRGMEKRMVAQLLTSIDALDPQNNRGNAPVIILGATNRSDSIDAALRRAGRFDKEILLGVPDEEARTHIIQTMTKGMKLSGDFNYKMLARKTPGYVGADIRSLTKEAAVVAIERIFNDVLKEQGKNGADAALVSTDQDNAGKHASQPPKPHPDEAMTSVVPLTPDQLAPLMVTMEDFEAAIPKVQPSSKREGFATVPDVSWDSIGALGSTREELTLSVLEPIRNPEKFQALGIPLPAGVMLYGPPGCGKTLLAKAIATESGANFISVKGPELLDKYVGESERSVRLVFERARASSPCIVFFDELDSLCPKRGSDSGGGGGVSERVVNQLLTEMDGLESRRSVFVIAATNRPELIDPAMMRPGRLDKLLYVPLPTPDDRVSILKAISKKVKLAPDVDLEEIGHSERAEGYSGADCAALLREAGLAVLKEDVGKIIASADVDAHAASLSITKQHFDYAFNHVIPSVSRKDQARYDRMRDRMAHARSRGAVAEAPSEGIAGEEEASRVQLNVDMQDAATTDALAGSQMSQSGYENQDPPLEVAVQVSEAAANAVKEKMDSIPETNGGTTDDMKVDNPQPKLNGDDVDFLGAL